MMLRMARSLTVLVSMVLVVAACGVESSDNGITTAVDTTSSDDASSVTQPTPVSEPLRIIATTTILGDIAANVVRDDGSVEVLLPPGADPHDYQISAAQAAGLYQADLVIATGLGLEEGLTDILAAAESDGVTILHVAEEVDPIVFSFISDHDEDGDHDHDEEADHDEDGDHHDDEEADHDEDGDHHDDEEADHDEDGDHHDDEEADHDEDGDHDHDEEADHDEDGDHHDDEEADHDEDGDHHDDEEADHDEDGDHHDDEEADHDEDGDHDHDEEADHDEDGDHDHDEEADHDEHGDHAHSGLDPHFWTDPLRVGQVAGLIADELAKLDDSIDWGARANSYQEEMRLLDEEIQAILAPIPDERRKLITNHDSLGYFADRYDFEVIGTVIPGGATLADPSSAELANLVSLIREEGINVIFAETIDSTSLADAVAAEAGTGVQVVTLFTGSLGEPGSESDTVAGMLLVNATRIAAALQES